LFVKLITSPYRNLEIRELICDIELKEMHVENEEKNRKKKIGRKEERFGLLIQVLAYF